MATLETNFYSRTLLGDRKGLHFLIFEISAYFTSRMEVGSEDGDGRRECAYKGSVPAFIYNLCCQ